MAGAADETVAVLASIGQEEADDVRRLSRRQSFRTPSYQSLDRVRNSPSELCV